MSKPLIFLIPKNASYAVQKAAEQHFKLSKSTNLDALWLTLSNITIVNEGISLKSRIQLIKYLWSNKNSIVYCITVFEVLLVWLLNLVHGKRKIIFWVQGLIDEEDYLRTGSKFRRIVFKILLRFSLCKSSKLVVVTTTMLKSLAKSYGLKTTDNTYVLPCTSRLRKSQKKRIENSYCYIGGLSAWQNVDIILQLFESVLESNPKAHFYFATPNHQAAKQLISTSVKPTTELSITLLNVSSENEVAHFLSSMQYGFLIRSNNILNQVASPIKLAEYLSMGVNVIQSESLIEYSLLLKTHNAGIVLQNNNSNELIEKLGQHKYQEDGAISCYDAHFKMSNYADSFAKFINT